MADTVDSNLNLQFSKLKYGQSRNSVFPSYGGVQRVIIEPKVIVAAMDHYMRDHLDDEKKLIVGVILGSRSNYGAKVEIKSCFPVKLIRSVMLNKVEYKYSREMFRRMCDLSTQANPGEVFVGWYSVGSDIAHFTKVLKDVFEIDSMIKGQAVYLLVDESFNTGRLEFTTYARVPVGVSCVKTPGIMCIPVSCTIKKLDKMTSDQLILKTTAYKERVTNLPTNFDNTEYFIRHLLTLIRGLLSYVRQVIDKKVPGNAAMGRYIMDILLSYSNFDPNLCNEKFSSNLHDILTSMYLATFTKTQLVISSKIQKIVSTKLFHEA